jgi:hypothetical protein
MKVIKLTIIALILTCSFQLVNAQVRVGVRIGTPPPYHRVVVVHRPVYVHHRYYAHPVYYRHAYYGRPYSHHHYYGGRPYRRHW